MKSIARGELPGQGNPFAEGANFKDDSQVDASLLKSVLQELEEMDRKKYSAWKAYGETSNQNNDAVKPQAYDLTALTYVEPEAPKPPEQTPTPAPIVP